MCKKVMFLVCLACLLGPASSVFAANLEVPWPPPWPGWCYVVSGTEEYCEINVHSCIIVPTGATLIMNCESKLDGNGDDGEGGDGAKIIVDGGTFIMRDRLNMGTDHDAYLIVDNGGTVIHTGNKVTIPDNAGGEHRLIILDGTYTSEETEIIADRDSKAIVGCNGILTTCNTDEGCSRTPSCWATTDVSGGAGEGGKALECDPGCETSGGVLLISDLGANCQEVICFLSTEFPWGPGPKDGATGEAAVTCDMVLTWNEGNCLGTKGRNHIFFSSDQDCVENSPSPYAGWTPPPCYLGQTIVGNDQWNVGPLPLWTKYYWRVDQGCPTMVKGPIWTFTTGCPLIPGDANLDCLVNFLDYAAVAGTWMGEEFFPDGCAP